jgi:geranylgeranyl pyrophosphate synthase
MKFISKNSENNITNSFKYLKNKIDDRLVSLDLGEEVLNSAFKYAMFPGRRIRPCLYLILKYKTDIPLITNEDYELSVALEIIHTASIIVDDFIDSDSKRRDIDTFQKRYGAEVMTCFSHLMLSIAFEKIGKFGNSEFLLKALKMYGEMAKGELGDISFYTPLKDTSWLELYRNIVEMKTGAIFGLSLFFAKKENPLYEKIGRAFGYFYQVSNDIYDELYSASGERGDKVGHILNFTFPIACLLDNCDDNNIKAWLQSLLRRRYTKPSELDKLKKIYLIEENRNVIGKKYNTIKNETIDIAKLLNSDEKKIIEWSIYKTDKPTFWNHKKLKSAGY